VALARGVYEERAFERMPVLADALEDAGCGSAAVLAHCRGRTSTSGGVGWWTPPSAAPELGLRPACPQGSLSREAHRLDLCRPCLP